MDLNSTEGKDNNRNREKTNVVHMQGDKKCNKEQVKLGAAVDLPFKVSQYNGHFYIVFNESSTQLHETSWYVIRVHSLGNSLHNTLI